MFHSIRLRWLLGIPVVAALLLAGCGGGGASSMRDVSSLLSVQITTGQGNGTDVQLQGSVQLDTCQLVFINGASETFDLNDQYTADIHSNIRPRLKYARVLAKNGSDYWYFDRSGSYLSQGASHPVVAVPGDY